MKFLVMLLVALGAWWLLRGLFRDRVSGDESRQNETPSPPAAPREESLPQEAMVACVFCQLYLPRSEAVWSGDRAFCGPMHLRAHEADGAGR